VLRKKKKKKEARSGVLGFKFSYLGIKDARNIYKTKNTKKNSIFLYNNIQNCDIE
jgi:hypothetical protein